MAELDGMVSTSTLKRVKGYVKRRAGNEAQLDSVHRVSKTKLVATWHTPDGNEYESVVTNSGLGARKLIRTGAVDETYRQWFVVEKGNLVSDETSYDLLVKKGATIGLVN